MHIYPLLHKGDMTMVNEVEIFKAVGEETRLRIMRILVKFKKELCACEIIDIIGKPQYNISKNLKILVKAGLIEERRDGKMMVYQVKKGDRFVDTMSELVSQIKCSSNEIFKNDYKRMEKRLSVRKDGKCVVPTCDCS